MNSDRPVIVLVAVGACLAAALTLAACGASAPAPKPAPAGTSSQAEVGTVSPDETGPVEAADASSAPPATTLAPGAPRPGLTKEQGDKATAVGTLQLREIEGDIWVVADTVPGAPGADKAKVLVVISDPELFDLRPLKGVYVTAKGTLGAGASTSNAGPQLIADTIEKTGYAK
jgi:hypothetical protein